MKVARSVRRGPDEKGVAKPPRRLATRLPWQSRKCWQTFIRENAASGNPWLRCLLVQAAHSASHQKRSYLGEQYRRIAKRRGAKRAAVAVAHSILVIMYHLLKNQTTYQEKGEAFFEEQERQGTEKRLVRQLSRLGYRVELQPLAQAG